MRRALPSLALALIAGVAGALTPRPHPPPPVPAQIEAYIACYPRVERVRERFRAEVERLKTLHRATIEAELGGGPGRPPDPHTFHAVQARYVYGPASARVFLPVVKGCGFADTLAYSDVGLAIRTAWTAGDPVLAPYRTKLEGMLTPNLE